MAVLEKIKVLFWRCTKGLLIRQRYLSEKKERDAFRNVLNSRKTVEYIKEHRCSVARFGDGEFQMVEHFRTGRGKSDFRVDTFQEYDPALAERLYEVFTRPLPNLLVCLPYPMFHSDVYRGYNRVFFEREWLGLGSFVGESVRRHTVVGDSTFTRFYLNRVDIKDYPDYISALKGIWRGRDVVLIEGEKSRLGAGNDLFDNVSSLRRILCPSTNAFSVYSRILDQVRSMEESETLYLLALGHTATALAYDLAREGYQAIDLGHVDIEYEWYRMGAKEKCPVPNKYVNEVLEGREVGNILDKEYESQIVGRVIPDKR